MDPRFIRINALPGSALVILPKIARIGHALAFLRYESNKFRSAGTPNVPESVSKAILCSGSGVHFGDRVVSSPFLGHHPETSPDVSEFRTSESPRRIIKMLRGSHPFARERNHGATITL